MRIASVRDGLRVLLRLAVGVFILANICMAALHIAAILAGSDPYDFLVYQRAAHQWGRELYGPVAGWGGFRYSPVSIPLLAVLTLMGETAWRLLHLAAVVALPGRLRLLAFGSYPFWFDVHAGNIMIFIAVSAYWTLRGSRWATGIFLVMALLFPRPLMLPVVAWVMVGRPEWRGPFAVTFVLHAAAVLLSGYGADWFSWVLSSTEGQIGLSTNVSPSAIVGTWWLLAALPLAAWAFWVGLPAMAGLLLQPYWLPYYLLVVLSDDSVPRLERRLGIRFNATSPKPTGSAG